MSFSEATMNPMIVSIRQFKWSQRTVPPRNIYTDELPAYSEYAYQHNYSNTCYLWVLDVIPDVIEGVQFSSPQIL